MNDFYTIGHSNRDINIFVDILKNNNIQLLVDVRSLPGSNKFPEYNKEKLEKTLKKNNINYVHLRNLGGYRTKSTIDNINSYWKNNSFKNYANYAFTDEFQDSLQELLKLGRKYKTAIMCAEVLWWRCHRRIITDYLIINNKNVLHIFDFKKIEKAILNKNAKKLENKIDYVI